MDRDSYLKDIARLKGFRPVRIVYHEVDYGEPHPFWNESKEYDSIDYGIDLIDEQNSCLSITWDAEFYMYGVSIKDASITQTVCPSTAIWDVSKNSRWAHLLGKEIRNTKIYWSWVEDTETKERTYYPQDLRITFEGGENVFISALEISETHIDPCADNLTVFFGKSEALKYEVGIE